MILPALYHWSPAERHDEIIRHGLIPGMTASIASEPQRHLCFSPSPSMAWSLSGGTGWHDAKAWDLWQVRLGPDDEVHVRPMWGGVVEEINVQNAIPADRVWWVARRELGDADAP